MNGRDLRQTEWVLCHRQDLISAGKLNEQCSPELIVALAEHALRRGYAPAALFGWFLQHEDSWTTVSKQDLAAGRTRLAEHRKRQKRLATQTRPARTKSNPAAAERRPAGTGARPVAKREETYLESDAYAVLRRGNNYRVPPIPQYSQVEIDSLSPAPPKRLRNLARRVLPAVVGVAAAAYLLTFRM